MYAARRPMYAAHRRELNGLQSALDALTRPTERPPWETFPAWVSPSAATPTPR